MLNNNGTLQIFKVLSGDEIICYVSDYSIDKATSQAKEEVAEAFDIHPESIAVECVNQIDVIHGKPAYQHILDCDQLIPQRVIDAL